MTINADCWLLSTPGWWSLINLQKDSLWGSTMLNTNIYIYTNFINFQAMWTVGTGNCKAPKREQLCVEKDENTKHIARCSNMFNHKVWQKQTMLAQVSKWPNQGSNCGSLSGNRWHSDPPQQNAIKASYTAIWKIKCVPKMISYPCTSESNLSDCCVLSIKLPWEMHQEVVNMQRWSVPASCKRP